MADRPALPPALVLAVAVTAISAAAVLFRLAEGVHPVVAAFWRTATVAALLAPSLRRPAVRRSLGRRDLALVVLAGLFLALHFWAWFASLQHTTVLRSTLLVCLTPVWAGVLEWTFLRNRPQTRFFVGIGVALAGVGLMSASLASSGGGSATGDVLATIGGVLSASYLLIGRSVRQRVGIGPYGALVCGATASWLLPVALVLGEPLTGFSPGTWLALAGLTLGPQLLGHIGMNYAVGYLSAAVVSAAILLEPVGSAVLGALVLGEWPGPLEWVGGAVVLAGVGVATLRRPTRPAAPPASSPPGGRTSS